MADPENRKNEEQMNELDAEDLGKVSGGVRYAERRFLEDTPKEEVDNNHRPIGGIGAIIQA